MTPLDLIPADNANSFAFCALVWFIAIVIVWLWAAAYSQQIAAWLRRRDVAIRFRNA